MAKAKTKSAEKNFSKKMLKGKPWISVEDRLPLEEDGEEFLLFHPFKRADGTHSSIIFVGYWDDLNKEWVCGWSAMFPYFQDNYAQEFIDEHFRLKKKKVIYWMPLPNPPDNESSK